MTNIQKKKVDEIKRNFSEVYDYISTKSKIRILSP